MNPIDSDIQWSIFFLVALAGLSSTAVTALPVEAWGIFFVSGLAARVSGASVAARTPIAMNQADDNHKGFFRVETEILRWKSDDTAPCDGLCDPPKFAAFIDT